MTVRRPDSLSEIEATEVGQHGNDKLWRQSGLNKMNSTRSIQFGSSLQCLTHVFCIWLFFIRQHCISELSPFLLNMESHMEEDFFPFIWTKFQRIQSVSQWQKCQTWALNSATEASQCQIWLCSILSRPAAITSWVTEERENLLYLDSPESVFLHLKDRIVYRDVSSVAAVYWNVRLPQHKRSWRADTCGNETRGAKRLRLSASEVVYIHGRTVFNGQKKKLEYQRDDIVVCLHMSKMCWDRRWSWVFFSSLCWRGMDGNKGVKPERFNFLNQNQMWLYFI